jgi:hypothetical protein
MVVAALVAVISGCSAQSGNPAATPESATTETQYADEEAISAIEKGLTARFDLVREHDENGDPDSSSAWKKFIQAELDEVEPFKDEKFKDSDLQELVIRYINVLNDSMDVVETYPMDSTDFYEKWNDVYYERSIILKSLADDYGLKLDDDHEEELEEILSDGQAAAKQSEMDAAIDSIVSSMTFEKQDEGYGSFNYVSTAQNTSEYNFTDVSLVIALYDANGVKVDETYASTNSWATGETVRFEAWSDQDAASAVASVEYYSVAE